MMVTCTSKNVFELKLIGRIFRAIVPNSMLLGLYIRSSHVLDRGLDYLAKVCDISLSFTSFLQKYFNMLSAFMYL